MSRNYSSVNTSDAYQQITDALLAEMEKGNIPWAQPWSSKGLRGFWSHETGNSYSLLNSFMLQLHNSLAGEYITFEQAKKCGGNVKKGEHGSTVFFWKWLDKPTGETDEDGNEIIKHFPCLKRFTVFSLAQCENVPQKYNAEEKAKDLSHDFTENKTIEQVISAYCKGTGLEFRQGYQASAFYCPAEDYIRLPLAEQFKTPELYYSTVLHEIAHSTGHPSRLNREMGAKKGDKKYATEELTAEITACILMSTFGIDVTKSFTNSVAYLQNWISVLQNDKKVFAIAAGRAEKAVEYILSFSQAA